LDEILSGASARPTEGHRAARYAESTAGHLFNRDAKGVAANRLTICVILIGNPRRRAVMYEDDLRVIVAWRAAASAPRRLFAIPRLPAKFAVDAQMHMDTSHPRTSLGRG